MADNSEDLKKTEGAGIENVEVEKGREMGGTGEETCGNLDMERYVSGEGSFIDEDEDIGDEPEGLVGEGTDDNDEVSEEYGGTSAVSWVEGLGNMKNAQETHRKKLRKKPGANNNFEMNDKSEERMQLSEVGKPPADLNVSREIELGAEQGESSPVLREREPFPETLLQYAKSSSYIPRAYLGAAFDKSCFHCCIRVSPVEYENLTEEQLRPLLKNADTVVMKVGPKDSPRVLELFCQDFSPLLPNLLFTPLGGDDINFELEKRQVTGQTEVEFQGKKISVPTSFDTSEAPHKVTFTLKQDFFQKHLNLERNKPLPFRLYHAQNVANRSLLISDLPATSTSFDIGQTLGSVFPLALKTVIEESENQKSAMLMMKSRATVMRHLMSVENLCIDGQTMQLGTGSLTQQEAVEQEKIKKEKKESAKLKKRLKREDREQEQIQKEKKESANVKKTKRQKREDREEQIQKEKKESAHVKKTKRQKRKDREQEQIQKEKKESANVKKTKRLKRKDREQEQSANLLRDQMGERQCVQRGRPNNNRSKQHSGNWSLGVRPTQPAERELSGMQDVTRAERWGGHGHWEPGGPRRQPDIPTGQGVVTPHGMEQGCSEEMLREKEWLEQMNQEAVHRLKMVEERQQQLQEELQQRQHDMEMENERMQRFGKKRHMKKQEKEYWEGQSRKRGRFEPVEHEARNQQHDMPSKRRRGEGEPWEERQDGQRSESSASGDSSKASMKRKLAMEVTRRAGELQKNLALLDPRSSDHAGAYASLREFHRDEDTGHGGRPSTSFNRQQKSTPDFETQQQQSYGKDFSQGTYGSNQGQDHWGQVHDYGEDLYDQDLSYSQWQPHRGGQANAARSSGYSQPYSQRGHGTGAKDANTWQVSGNHRTSEYSQSQAYSQTTGYDHEGRQGGYQQGRRQGRDSSRPYGHAENRERGSSGQPRNYRDRWFTNSNRHRDQDRRDIY